MNLKKILLPSVLLFASCAVWAEEVEVNKTITSSKVFVGVKTDDVDLHEFDISHLQPGDSETIVTESGRTIDLLRTKDDVEIYIDGEILDPDAQNEPHQQVHYINKTVEVICEGDGECDEAIAMSNGQEGESEGAVHSHKAKKIYIIEDEDINN